MTRCKNATQENARIESESILALYCVATSVNTKATHCVASYYCEPTLTVYMNNQKANMDHGLVKDMHTLQHMDSIVIMLYSS